MYIEKVNRSDRLEKNIKKAITLALRDVNLNNRYATLTVSYVDVSRDLKNAKIFYTCFAEMVDDGPSLVEITTHLQKDVVFLRQLLAKELCIKRIPAISFHYDKVDVQNRKVNQIIDAIEFPEAE